MNIKKEFKNAVFSNSIIIGIHSVLVRKRLVFFLTAITGPLCPAAGMWTYFVLGRWATDASSISVFIEFFGMIIAASVLFTGYFIMPWLGLFSSFVVLFYGKMWWKLIGAVALVLNLFMCAVNGTLNMIVRFI